MPLDSKYKFKIQPLHSHTHVNKIIDDPEAMENLIVSIVTDWQGIQEIVNFTIRDSPFTKEKFRKLLQRNTGWIVKVINEAGKYGCHDYRSTCPLSHTRKITFVEWFLEIATDMSNYTKE